GDPGEDFAFIRNECGNNVVECDAGTFLGLCVGALNWDDAVASGRVDASGTRANLSEFLPLVHVAGADH
ncbi:sterol carrier family protein, partial [Actinotignum timonense]|uniref:sterol carrier family protein n=1 Tax=Actinotignum timonense TaxID=1870995 RepID=UPI002A82888D